MRYEFRSENANGPGISEAVCEKPIIWYPVKVSHYYQRRSRRKSSYFRRAAPRPATAPHVPERQLLLTAEKVDVKGFEPSPATLMGCRAAVTPQAHASKRTSARLAHSFRHANFSVKSFVSGIALFPTRRFLTEGANGPGSPRPSARTDKNRHPIKVIVIIDSLSAQIKLL